MRDGAVPGGDSTEPVADHYIAIIHCILYKEWGERRACMIRAMSAMTRWVPLTAGTMAEAAAGKAWVGGGHGTWKAQGGGTGG